MGVPEDGPTRSAARFPAIIVPGLYKLIPAVGTAEAKKEIKKNNARIVELKDEIRKKRILLNTLRKDLEALKETLADMKAKLEECKE